MTRTISIFKIAGIYIVTPILLYLNQLLRCCLSNVKWL